MDWYADRHQFHGFLFLFFPWNSGLDGSQASYEKGQLIPDRECQIVRGKLKTRLSMGGRGEVADPEEAMHVVRRMSRRTGVSLF